MLPTIRIATEADIPVVTALYNSDTNLFGEDETGYSEDDICEYMLDLRKKMILCIIDNKITGALLAEYHETYAYLETIIVDKEYQGQGIGNILMAEFEKEVRKRKITLIEGMTDVRNTRMQNLFSKEKYKQGNTFIFYYKNLQ
jgi:ribosomal protein S18 acetylase RimI-like enzyme